MAGPPRRSRSRSTTTAYIGTTIRSPTTCGSGSNRYSRSFNSDEPPASEHPDLLVDEGERVGLGHVDAGRQRAGRDHLLIEALPALRRHRADAERAGIARAE